MLLHGDDFIKDCVREEERHRERCAMEPDYCIGYLKSWTELLWDSDKPFEQLGEKELKDLIWALERLLYTAPRWDIKAAVKSLLEHARKRLEKIQGDDFGRAVANLGRMSVWA